MKRIELRTNFARWFGCIARHHENVINDLNKALNRAREKEKIEELKAKIREHQKIVNDNREEQRRYLLQSRICGNEVLVIR